MMLRVSLGDRIRSAREAAGKSREELADQVGVSVKTIGNWETDRVTPKSKLGALERVLGVQLRGTRGRQGVDLDDASDAQVLSNIAGRLAERDVMRDRIRELTAEVQALRAQLSSISRGEESPAGAPQQLRPGYERDQRQEQ
ncbi:helix-turn-helix transcriptional regulator [Pseudonocardia zijingensis]|uniref:HTH cro/C1-type domain-containing protein n=1 Tax=Pseudonocardia zijingensis TaxID=153376 RepID=A0ABP3YP04_9PSEU